jgi:EpsI family protein
MTARRDGEREYVAFWFQAHDEATASSFQQKVALVRHRLAAAHEDSAFVRINFPVLGRSEAECRDLALAFLNAFYPVYQRYVRKEL